MKRTNILSKLKSQVNLIESVLTEGKHWHWPEDYRQKAINRIELATSGKMPKYPMSEIEQDVNEMMTKFKKLLRKNSNAGYFLPVIRMFIDYAGNDQAKRKEFIGSENSENSKIDMIVNTLDLISNDPSLEAKLKDDIKNRWSLEEFEKAAAELQAEINKNDAAQLASVDNANASDYDIISINSYEELHEKFGGDKTGYKGESEWCHTNGKSTYDSWTDNGTKMFFVLAKKGWENIQPPDPKTTNAFDEYGTSLIAILVSVYDCELLNATLRWNHVIDPSETVPKTSVDRAFLGWGDLSKDVGFNVKTIIEKELKEHRNELKNKIENINNKVSAKLKTVTEIDSDAISSNDKQSLIHIEIPDNVTSIGLAAFRKCSNLTKVIIPDSVTIIDNSAFSYCTRLTNVTIPDSVKSIGSYAFGWCSGLTSVTIPDSVTSIGDYAFEDCSSLTSITIPNSVTSIGRSTFYGCRNLRSITISRSVTSIGDHTFENCSGLMSITIPDSVTSIGDYAFCGCGGLTSITIPDSVKSIGYDAFWDCSGLTSVAIPDSVKSIDNSAFDGCNKLSSVTFKGKTIDKVRSMKGYPWDIKNPKEVIRVAESSN